MRIEITESQLILALWSCLTTFTLAENVISTNSGPSSNRVDVVFLGDGYQEHEFDLYHEHVDGAIDHMFFGDEQPFSRYRNYFNFHRIEVISAESGADIPPDDFFVDTALDARYFYDGVTERLLSINSTAANTIVNRSLSRDIDVDMRFTSVNSTKYGGAGGRYATFAGGNSSAYEVALHEVGHSFSNLADEYEGFDTPYSGAEPSEANVTTDPSGAKWERWLGYEQEGIGTIGVYEGGRYHSTGIYRPSIDSKMRTLNRPFDAVSREQLVLDIYAQVDPLDDHRSSATALGFDDDAWVNVVDEDIIDLTWYIDGTRISYDQPTLPVREFMDLGFVPGSYELSVEATDNTDWIRLEDERPRQEVLWSVSYYPGDFNEDESVDAQDMDLLSAAVLIGDNDARFDLTGDALVDQADRDFWVAANQTWYGDADLNRTVEFADFLVLSGSFGTDAMSWAQGNFDGEAGVGFGDFLQLSANFGLASPGQPANVPEPNLPAVPLAAMVAWLLLSFRPIVRRAS